MRSPGKNPFDGAQKWLENGFAVFGVGPFDWETRIIPLKGCGAQAPSEFEEPFLLEKEKLHQKKTNGTGISVPAR